MGTRRFGNAGVASLQAVQSIIDQVGSGFVAKQNPIDELTQEIEKCSRKIWACAADQRYRKAKKARTSNVNITPSDNITYEEQRLFCNGEIPQPVRQPRDELEVSLNAMKYRDMQLHCKEYGLTATGNKEILRERLMHYLSGNHDPGGRDEDEVGGRQERKSVEKVTAMRSDEIPCGQDLEFAANDGVKMEVDPPRTEKANFAMEEENVTTLNDIEQIRVNVSSHTTRSEKLAPEPEEKDDGMDFQPSKDPPGKTVSETASSLDAGAVNVAKSPLRTFVKDAVNHLTHSAQKARFIENISTPGDHLSPPPSDFTTSTSCSKVSGARVREIVSKLTTNQTNSTLSGKLQASKDARMARLAEMRGKAQMAKTITASSSALKVEQSSLVTKPTPSSNQAKNLATQMREKALRTEKNSAHRTAPSRVDSSAKPSFALKSATIADPLGTTLKSTGLGTALKTYSVKKKRKSPPRPSQTYEISDREDSDSDDSEAEDGKRKKDLPKWVAKENLRPALHTQYIGNTSDPDDIFGEVHTCDLEAIFGNQLKSKYRNRTSSGNWSQDRVTTAEKLVYKRAMGFVDEI